MSENHNVKQKKSGWRGIIWLCVILLFVAVLTGLWWWHSDADLDDVHKQAKANNIPTSWAEIGLKRSSPERLACWERITSLTNQLPAYQMSKKATDPAFKIFTQIPEEMRKHHAAFDTTVMSELDNELQLLGDEPLCFEEAYTYSSKLPEVSQYRNLIRLLQERIALANPTDAKHLCRIQLALCRSAPRNMLISHIVRVSLINISLSSVTIHLNDFKTTASHEIANDLSLTTSSLANDLIQSFIGAFQCNLDAFSNRHNPKIFSSDWFMPLVMRGGRHYLLTEQIDRITFMRNHGLQDNLVWNKKNMDELNARRGGIPTPEIILRTMLQPAYDVTLLMTYENLLKSQLLEAELRGQSWPTDVFDPTNSPLRPIVRDGKIIGAYTVGKDGIDNGGDKKNDKYFPLYGPLDAPTVTTP